MRPKTSKFALFRPLNEKIFSSKEILKLNSLENSENGDECKKQKDLEAITEDSHVFGVDKSRRNWNYQKKIESVLKTLEKERSCT